MPQVELQDPVLDATDPNTRLLLLAEHWKRNAMLHKSRADTQREELLRAWFVLKEFGHHPGRTDDTLSECARRALAANCKEAAADHNEEPEPRYTAQEVADACAAVEIPDSKCESLLLALGA